jgi:hypothetical protein
VVFHFNKAHLADQTIPMWVLKFHGETLYVNHVNCRLPWSTKETPDNPSTKGSIKVKNALLRINELNEATLTELTAADKTRLSNQKLGITRIITGWSGRHQLNAAFKEHNIKHGPIKSMGSACSSTYYVTDIMNKQELTFLLLKMAGTDCRVLQSNEELYKVYDDPKYQKVNDIDLDAHDYDVDFE